VSSVAIHPDGYIVSGSTDNTVRIWNKDTTECVRVYEGHTDYEMSVAIYKNGYKFSNDNSLRLWSKGADECVSLHEGHTDDAVGYLTSQYWDADRVICHALNENLVVFGMNSGKLHIFKLL